MDQKRVSALMPTHASGSGSERGSPHQTSLAATSLRDLDGFEGMQEEERVLLAKAGSSYEVDFRRAYLMELKGSLRFVGLKVRLPIFLLEALSA